MGLGKSFEQERAALRAHHEALEIDLWRERIDLLDYYRGTLTWRRLSLWIRHFWADPSSALFAAIAQSVAPPSTDDVLDGMSMHQQMQMLRWTSTDELLLGVSNEVRNVMALVLQIKSAEAKKPAPVIPSLKRPWEHTDGADAESVRAQIDEYNSPESLAARAAVTGAPIPDPGKG